MIKHLPQQTLQQIVNFAIDNYDTAPDYLFPKTIEELVAQDGESEVFMMEDDYGIEAMCLVKMKYPHIAEVYRSVVRMDLRGIGLSKELDKTVENTLRNSGVKKIQTFIYVDNIPNVFRRLKRNFLVEGLLRNQDGRGMNTYIMGKEL